MKKALLIAALTVAVTPAMASKARLSALNNAAYLTDIQDVFVNPARATQHGEWLTFEMGQTATTNAATTGTHAEGGFSRSMDAARWGFYMGHNYTFSSTPRSLITAAGGVKAALPADNTINLFYASNAGDMAWGLGLAYSKTDKKTTTQKQDMTALSAGIIMGAWDLGATLGLVNTYKDEQATAADARSLKGKMALNIDAQYTMDTMIYSLGYGMNGAKIENGSGTQLNDQEYSNWYLGAEKMMKSEGATFFYGAKYTMDTEKNKVGAGTKTETSKLPVYAGIEADAASWLVLRGSVKQNFILGQTDNGTNKDTIANDTTVAAGAGLKFGKLTVDGTLEAANSATAALNGNNLLANGSITYMF